MKFFSLPVGASLARLSESWKTAILMCVQALVVAACLFVYLDGFRRDFRVPLTFESDGLAAIMQSKGTVDNGWWWFNPMLGAPFGLDALAFPANNNVDQAIVWAVSRAMRNAVATINVAWLLMLVLSGLSATWCLRTLGSSCSGAFLGGTLFALSPYGLYRQIDHLWMVTYLVPFASTAALLLAMGRLEHWYWGRRHLLLVGGCALLGFNYVYYAFFGCFVIVVGGVAGYFFSRRRSLVAASMACVSLISLATLLNLAPSLQSWNLNGKPLLVRDKLPAESEMFGLKIRQLVSPSIPHFFPPFRTWNQKEAEAKFPIETENRISRLGLVSTLGFLGLMGTALFPSSVNTLRDRVLLLAAGQLTLASVLLGTVGGFGSLFSLLITPQIRGYNRIAPFIAFFSLIAVVFALESICRTHRKRAAAVLAVLAIGLADQRVATSYLNAAHTRVAADVATTETFVKQLEARLPGNAMILQLPFRPYLNDSGIARMRTYDHLRLYVLSRTIRWSYPALSNKQLSWQQAAAQLAPPELARQIAAQDFAAIVIDRFGYEDNGAKIIAALQSAAGVDAILIESDRYVAVDIRALADSGKSSPIDFLAPPVAASSALVSCGDGSVAFIDQIGLATWPFTEQPVRIRASDGLRVGGWAVDLPGAATAAAVDVSFDQHQFPSVYGIDRSDVAEYLKKQGYTPSGFVVQLPQSVLSQGTHTLSIRVVAADRRCYYTGPTVPIFVE